AEKEREYKRGKNPAPHRSVLDGFNGREITEPALYFLAGLVSHGGRGIVNSLSASRSDHGPWRALAWRLPRRADRRARRSIRESRSQGPRRNRAIRRLLRA